MKTLKGMRFNMEFIWRCLFYYFRFSLSLREVALMMEERGFAVSHVSIYNWVLRFGPCLEEKFRKHKLPVNTSWRIDETYIKINGEWKYLYRAVDKNGDTVDFLLTAKRDLKAAKRFLKKAIKNHGSPLKAAIDKSGANLASIEAINSEQIHPIEIRQNKYLNNIVEQDHRGIKKRVRPMLGFKNFHSAKIIITGVEILRMIFKNQTNYLPLFNLTPIETFWAIAEAVL